MTITAKPNDHNDDIQHRLHVYSGPARPGLAAIQCYCQRLYVTRAAKYWSCCNVRNLEKVDGLMVDQTAVHLVLVIKISRRFITPQLSYFWSLKRVDGRSDYASHIYGG